MRRGKTQKHPRPGKPRVECQAPPGKQGRKFDAGTGENPIMPVFRASCPNYGPILLRFCDA